MSYYTTEGHTQEPILPTTCVINFPAGNLVVDDTADWKDASGGDRALQPDATPLDEAYNGDYFPVKIDPNPGGTDKFIRVAPGTYRAEVRILIKETSASADAGVGIALVDDDTESHVASTTTFAEFDGAASGIPQAQNSVVIPITGIVRFSQESNLRLVVVNRKTVAVSEVIALRDCQLVLTRIAEYTAI